MRRSLRGLTFSEEEKSLVRAASKQWLGAKLAEVRSGAATFDEVVAGSLPFWSGIARWLHGRWVVPPGFGQDDVLQELLLEAWRRVFTWEPGRGTSLRGYVVWRAIAKAKRAINIQRNSKGRSGRERSRFPANESAFIRDGEDAPSLPEPSRSANQEAVVDRIRALEVMLAQCRGARQRAALAVLVECGGCVITAAEVIVADEELALLCRARTVRGARKLIYRVLANVAGVSVLAARAA